MKGPLLSRLQTKTPEPGARGSSSPARRCGCRPPDAAATAVELQDLRALAAQRDAAVQERIRYWDFSSPSHRWNDMLIDINAANPFPGGGSIRAFAMLNIALHDAMIAAWDTQVRVQPPASWRDGRRA